MSEAADIVRAHDRDRWLSTFFAPDAKRLHLLALYAFNAEVVKIRDTVSEPHLGMIRLQWWRNALDSIYAGDAAPRHPVAEALALAIKEGGLPQQALADLVTAHEFDLFHDRMPGLTELEAYLGEAWSRLIMMAAMILDRDAAKASECAGLAGVAQGLALILGDPRRRDPFLPEGMDVQSAIGHAGNRLAQAMTLLPALPKSVLPAFLPVSLTGLYLKKIAAAPDVPLAVSPLRRQAAMWWTARRWG
ncbi:MAG: squalene/phytoene synthase family protein [Aestuariivirga sp.]|uniref:phytoene/squalene synthase family protein n=1 Tax=Aestuariivirga sp. TaxID=2650926 RepID=UPI0025BC000B|nr:squalene/phytoene synthase family protein [Aestuariivirga sp.]MCA3561325.1 squalene/phytoene synthase family protein [Aestuariivirga sp.]